MGASEARHLDITNDVRTLERSVADEGAMPIGLAVDVRVQIARGYAAAKRFAAAFRTGVSTSFR